MSVPIEYRIAWMSHAKMDHEADAVEPDLRKLIAHVSLHTRMLDEHIQTPLLSGWVTENPSHRLTVINAMESLCQDEHFFARPEWLAISRHQSIGFQFLDEDAPMTDASCTENNWNSAYHCNYKNGKQSSTQ